MKTIIFTGGGSGGHVIPALTLIQEIKKSYSETKIVYLGGIKSIEREVISEVEGVQYYPIQTGKLRRYFSVENFIDFFRFVFGILQAFIILLKYSRNSLVFSTGGFVALPVAIAGRLQGKKVWIHEQTSRVGLANKISSYFATKVFISFEESKKFFPTEKTIHSGYPLKSNCFEALESSLDVEGQNVLEHSLPVLLVTGGGNGSALLNDFVKENLNELTRDYLVIHQVGKNQFNEFISLKSENYIPLKFASNLVELMKVAQITISRAGAGTVMELIALKKKSVFVPLKIAQKNEQFHNASEAKKLLGSLVVSEDEFKSISWNKLRDDFETSNSETSDFELKNGTKFLVKELQK